MKKDKFITVMAILDNKTQELMQRIQTDLEHQYGVDTKTKDIPFHITLGSYAVEDTTKIVGRIMDIAIQTSSFDIEFEGLNHFNNLVRFMEPKISDELLHYIVALTRTMQMDMITGYLMQQYIAIVSRWKLNFQIKLPPK